MSKNIKGYLGDQRNKLGNAVGYVINGVQLYRSYTNIVANPRTTGQVYARTKFTKLMEVAKAMKVASNIGFKFSKSPLQSGTSTFMKVNYPAVSGDTVGELQVEYSQLMVSRGGAYNPTFGTLRLEDSLQISATWNNDGVSDFSDREDKVYLVAYQPDTQTARVSAGYQRSALAGAIFAPAAWSGLKVYVFAFVVSAKDIFVEGTKVVSVGEASETAYLGSGTVV